MAPVCGRGLVFLSRLDWPCDSVPPVSCPPIGPSRRNDAHRRPMRGCHTWLGAAGLPAPTSSTASISFSSSSVVSLRVSLSCPQPDERNTRGHRFLRTTPRFAAQGPSVPPASAMLRLIFLAALAGFARASDVIEFTDDDFESKIGDHDLILVEFFAPW